LWDNFHKVAAGVADMGLEAAGGPGQVPLLHVLEDLLVFVECHLGDFRVLGKNAENIRPKNQ
jgi:hypothetical protein